MYLLGTMYMYLEHMLIEDCTSGTQNRMTWIDSLRKMMESKDLSWSEAKAKIPIREDWYLFC